MPIGLLPGMDGFGAALAFVDANSPAMQKTDMSSHCFKCADMGESMGDKRRKSDFMQDAWGWVQDIINGAALSL